MQASCSQRLLQPFMRLATTSAAHQDLVPAAFWEVPANGRVPLEEVHAMLERGTERFRDDRLGLRLGTAMTLGTAGAFDFVVRTAPTVRESFSLASRYSRLLTDSFRVSFETRRRQAVIRLDDDGACWPRTAADFAMSSLYKLHVADQVPASHLECWFAYAAPAEMTLHNRTFPGATLRFDAPAYAFVCDASYADAPMSGADAPLHALLRARADALLADLANVRSVAAVVRDALLQTIPDGDANADRVARSLRMSRRTMSRRLERECTSFQAELDAARRALAVRHLQEGRLALTEIAFLSGFSHVESFHRAFKRWTGQTPLEYRATRGDA